MQVLLGEPAIKKKILDKRDRDTCGLCKGDTKKSKKQTKFFGHPVCSKCAKSIPSPFKAYAAMLIETEGLEEEGMIIDMKQTYEQGREQKSTEHRSARYGGMDIQKNNEGGEANTNKTTGGSTG